MSAAASTTVEKPQRSHAIEAMRQTPPSASRVRTPAQPIALTDEQVRQFITRGFVTLASGLDKAEAQAMVARIEETLDDSGNPGNNLLPQVPQLRAFLNDGVTRGALRGIVGSDPVIQPHRHGHILRGPSHKVGGWHQDSVWGYRPIVRAHRPWMCMLMYFPHEVTLDNGPTSVITGSQYYPSNPAADPQLDAMEGSWREFGNEHLEAALNRSAGHKTWHEHVPAGTMLLIHYDLWHAASKRDYDGLRVMIKLQFGRRHRPQPGQWNDLASTNWASFANDFEDGYALAYLWRSMAAWMTGQRQPTGAIAGLGADGDAAAAKAAIADKSADTAVVDRVAAVHTLAAAGDAQTLTAALADLSDAVGLEAAYALAALGEVGTPGLIDAISGNVGDSDNTRALAARRATHGLASAGAAAVPALVAALSHTSPDTRLRAAYALGEHDAPGDAGMNALAAACRDDDTSVRGSAVEAIGKLAAPSKACIDAIAHALTHDADDMTRFRAATSLCQQAEHANTAVDALITSLEDPNRYVFGFAVEALRRINDPAAHDAAFEFLAYHRYCPNTSRYSTF